jgi:NAD(P)-dependent dehydrogenase (short-subunit alcohol dehydrogenase family)
VALVTGASRGVGRGIALALGEAQAVVYITCRSEDSGTTEGLPGTIHEAAEAVTQRDGALSALEESALATLLLEWAELGGLRNRTSCASEMLPRIAKDVDPKVRGSARWPKTPRTFSNELRRIAPQLRARGISVKFTRTCDHRLITIHADQRFDDSETPDDNTNSTSED